MKAIRVHKFGDPSVMCLEEMTDLKPSSGQVLVQVKACGVNPVDAYIRSGNYAASPKLPYTPGFDGAGIVKSCGQGVTGISVGDRVYSAGTLSGAYAEEALCLGTQVHPLPDNISFSQGAGVYVPYASAYRSLFLRANAVAGETVLVHGASGGVGIASVQLARAYGMTVIGTAGTERGRDLCSKEGAHIVLDHHDREFVQKVMDFTNGNGVHVVLEMLANVNLAVDLKVLSRGGRVVIIGSRGSIEIDPRMTMSRESAILGMSLMNVSPEDSYQINKALVAGLEKGFLRPVVGRELPLKDAPQAHESVMKPGSFGKIVLLP